MDALLYESDFVAWTEREAAALRRAAEARVNLDIDFEHLAEEIEDLGKSERDAVRSQIRRIIEHLLKLEYSPTAEARAEWRTSIIEARDIVFDKMTRTLHRDIETLLPTLYEQSRRRADAGLRRFGEAEAADALPVQCAYGVDDLARHDWDPTNRDGLDITSK